MLDGFARHGRRVRLVDIEELAPHVSPESCFSNAAAIV
jgi:hypothetical protein